MQESLERVVVTLPTYNEAENIEKLCRKIFGIFPGINILVIDDDSPDGTWAIIERLQRDFEGLHLLRRRDQRGRGTAGRDGFLRALNDGAEYIIEMDADFSHNPEYIANLLQVADSSTLVIGSRLVEGGGEAGRKKLRKWITFMANWYIRFVLGLNIRDCTTGFRVFSREILESIDVGTLDSRGPEIVQETLYRCKKAGVQFREIPIIFEERAAGESTFSIKIMFKSLFFILYLRFFYRFESAKNR